MKKKTITRAASALSLLFFFVSGLTLTSCINKDKTEHKKTGEREHLHRNTLVLATNSEPDTLNPIFAEMAASHEILFLGQRELTMYNDRWELIPDLAQTVPTMENGLVSIITKAGDKKTKKMVVTWNIKKNAMWEDGVPVTAKDFIFAWKVCLDPTQEIIDRDTCERVDSMEAKGSDSKTLLVTWKEPFAFYNGYRVHSILPAHFLKHRYYAPNGSTRNLKKDRYGISPLSNGPFRFKEWVPGQYIRYIRNKLYKPKPHFEEIIIQIIPNNMSLESNLNAGNIDGVTASGGLSVSQIENMKKRSTKKFKYYSVPGLVWAHIDFNLDDPWLADIRVRKALAHSINRAQLIELIYFGKFDIADSFLPPRHWGYFQCAGDLAFDLKKAARLLDEAGWKLKTGEKIRRNKGGEKLVLNLSAVAGIKDIEQVQQVFQSDLRSIGVELRIQNKPAKVFFGEFGRHRKFPHLSFYSWIMDPGGWPLTLWHKDYIPTPENQWQGQNYPGWINHEASQLLEKVPVELDLAQRQVMMRRVQELWAKDLPAIPMYFRPVVAVTDANLMNYRPTGTTTPVTWNAWEWKFKDETSHADGG